MKSIPKNPLLSRLRKAYQVALLSSRKNAIPADELFDKYAEESASRRRFISNISKAGIAVGAAGLLNACKKVNDVVVPPVATQPDIVIIGGGMAGLNCAYQLKKAGYTSTIYEAANRVGGRIYTKKNIIANDVSTELGGEFIDSSHSDMLQLCDEFGIPLIDLFGRASAGLKKDSYFFNGQFYTIREVIAAFKPYAARIQKDIDSLPDIITYDNYGNAARFDKLSISEYFDLIGMSGWIRKALEAAYLTEYGREVSDQSSINFLYLFSADVSQGSFDIFGDSDERYKIAGGNSKLINALHEELKDNVHTGEKLVKIKQESGSSYTLYFNTGGATKNIKANMVVLTIPFSVLRHIELDVELPAWKKNAIDHLGYGTNAKLLMGFTKKVWQHYNYSGYIFSDGCIQNGWDHSELQTTSNGGYTAFVGGNEGISLGEGTPDDHAKHFVKQLNHVWPGCGDAYNGKAVRIHWPSYPFTLGSYACYKPGQFTTIAGAEHKKAGNLYFAGEHCSLNYQGYMNGAAETGNAAARQVIKTIR